MEASRWAAAALAALATLVLTAWSAGCGGEDRSDRAQGASMQPSVQHRSSEPADARSNRAPRIEAVRFEPAWPAAHGTIRARVEARDADGDPLSFRFTWTEAGDRVAERGPEIDLYRARKGDPIEVTVTASDGRSESEPFDASTRLRNAPPELSAVEFSPANGVGAGAELKVVPTAADADGDPISYEYTWWVNDNTAEERGPVLSTVGLTRGDRIRAIAVASDGEDESDRLGTSEIILGNAPPVIVSTPEGTGPDGVWRYEVVADDPDRVDRLRIRLAQGPEGMVMSTRGRVARVEWIPREDQAGEHLVEIVVEDPDGARTQQRFRVMVDAAPAAPMP